MIYFRGRKYQETIDCSFFVKDGPNISSLEQYMVGDRVSLMVDVRGQMAEAICDALDVNNLSSAVRVFRLHNTPEEQAVTLFFRVVERRHALSYERPGNLMNLGTSIYLEAEDGYAEDVFRWIFLDKKPAWVEE